MRIGQRSRFLLHVAALCAATLLCSCATLRFREGISRPAEKLPACVLERYAYPKTSFELARQSSVTMEEPEDSRWRTPFRYTMTPASNRDVYTLQEVRIYAGATTVRFDYYKVLSDTRAPAVLVFPIFGGDYVFAKMFANHFARHGLSCALIHRKKGFAEAKTFEEFEPPLRKVVLDSKIVIDWLCDRAEIDSTRIGAFGISMGGIKSTLIKCLDHRVGPAVVALAGGSLADILASSQEPKVVERREELMREERIDTAEFRRRADGAIFTDTLDVARYADGSEIKMFVSLFDRTVPTRLQFRLWRSLGRPQLSVLPFGHYTSALALPYARWQSLRFFERKFGMKKAAPRSAVQAAR